MESNIPKFPPIQNKNRLNISLDSRKVIIVLLVVIVGMIFIWKPWNKPPQNTDRTVQVNGEATIKADPDEFIFSPSYEFKNANKQAALSELSKKSDEIVSQLKKLGVPDSNIKTNADGYERGVYFPSSDTGQNTYSLMINVNTDSKDQAQKIQNYLVTTSPSGAVTPYSTFSKPKQKELEGLARDLAEKDARKKAEKSAKNIGFKLGAIKTVQETNGFGGVTPLEKTAPAIDQASPTSSISVQPGQSDINYQISVTYYIK
jgi:uncharacterized protein YggE